MKKRNLNKKIVSGVMAALMLSSAVPFSVSAADASVGYSVTEAYTAPVSLRSAGTALDFSYAGATAVRSVDVSDLIEQATGTEVSAEEAAYLASEGISMTYDEGLSSSLVTSAVSGDSSITFTARVKTYQAYNGSSVRWVPVSVTLDGNTVSFVSSPQGYTASFSGLTKDKVYTATFHYETNITVSAYAMTSVINYAYNNAQAAIAAEEEYEQAKDSYENAHLAYQNAIKEYETLYAEYQKYQQDFAEYTAELSAYNAYLKKVSTYEEAMKKYNAYLEELAGYDEKYAEYEAELAALPEKQAEYEKYLEYLALVQSATKQLDVVKSCFVADSAGRTMYATLMGDTVDAVLANKSTLINYGGADANDINNAGNATTALRSLLKSYSSCTTNDARLAWYQTNYSSLKSNFIMLYSSLENLGGNTAVKRYLASQDKLERYCQFVCQLYIISTGLDDSTTFNVGYSYNGYALVDLIEPVQRINDTNSYSPSGTVLPEKMEPVSKPTVPTAPKKPTEVSEPVKTWTEDVSHPGDAPAVVKEPKMPTLSDFTSGMPQMPEISTRLRAVVDLVRANKLTQRSGGVRDVSLKYDASFSTAASISSSPVVTFYDYDKKTVLYSVQVQQGGNAVYGGVTPSRESDAQYSYVFSGWTDANGNDAGLYGITQNTSVYAKYTQKLNEYTVVWNVAGKRVSETYAYGEKPVYEGELSYRDNLYQYTFAGWSPSVVTVTGDAEYTAQYTMRQLDSLTFGVTFEVRSETYYRTYSYGEIPNFSDFEKDYVWGGYRYVFTGWSPTLSAVTENTKYVANFERTYLIPAGENGDKSAEMTVTKTAHTVTTDESVVNAAYAVGEALKANTQLVLELGGATVTIDNAALQKIPGAAYFRLTSADGLSWKLEVTDEAGNALSFDSEILAELPISEENANGGRLNAYVNGISTGVTVQDGVAYLRLANPGEIDLRPYYSVTVLTEGSGDMVAEKETAEAGSSVTLNTYLEQGWAIETLMISVNGGAETALTLTDGAFIMPKGNITVRAVFAEAEYTVVFVADGVEISRETYRYGDIVKVPDMSEMLIRTEGDTTYTFYGWDSEVTAVKGDIVYTAVYTEETDGEDPYKSPYDSNKLITVVLPIVGVVLTLGIAAFLFFFIRKKKYGKGLKDLKGDIIALKDKVVRSFRSAGHKDTPNDKK